MSEKQACKRLACTNFATHPSGYCSPECEDWVELDGEQQKTTEKAKSTPGPWQYCGENRKPSEHCRCGMIWSIPHDCHIATVIIGEWGDEYPAIKVETPGAIAEPAKPYMEKIVYGEIPKEEAEANAALIAQAWRIPGLEKELQHANRIIARLYRLVNYYGYAEEAPPLREAERRTALGLNN